MGKLILLKNTKSHASRRILVSFYCFEALFEKSLNYRIVLKLNIINIVCKTLAGSNVIYFLHRTLREVKKRDRTLLNAVRTFKFCIGTCLSKYIQFRSMSGEESFLSAGATSNQQKKPHMVLPYFLAVTGRKQSGFHQLLKCHVIKIG